MKKLLHLLVLLVIYHTHAQIPYFKGYDWDTVPNYKTVVSADYDTNILKHKVVTEFFYEDDELVEYFLEHLVIQLDSDEAIENYNKVYIPFSTSSKVDISKARVINKDGEIQDLDQSKILTSSDEETGQRYKYFAFEGINKGSIIDYYYVIKKTPNFKGRRISLQSGTPRSEVMFELLSPKNLEFAFKSYNGLPEVKKDTLTQDKLHWKLFAENIEPLEEEEFSVYSASKGAVVYKLHKNLANNKIGFASYDLTTKNLYNYYFPEYSKKELAHITDYIKQIEFTDKNDEQAVIRAIERHIKTNVYMSEISNPNLSDLGEIIKNNVASEAGIIKLYIAIFKAFEITQELVFTSDRQVQKFDKDFEALNFLTDVLIYFPKHKSYLSPNDIETRYGFPLGYLTDNYGLFIKEVNLGGFKSGLGKTKYIDAVAAERTHDNMHIDVKFDEDLSSTIINIKRSMGGYYAMYLQPFLHLANNEERRDVIDNFAKNIDEDATILSRNVANDTPESFGVKPFNVDIEFSSEAFTEDAGRKILLKVGELIGEQSQLYQEKQRHLPVENEYNRAYLRTIKISIPDGYHFTNLDDLNIDNKFSEDGTDLMSFKSSFELNNNILTITADEYYRKNILDTSLFEEFRKVINSAADFNKIVLVLEPTD
ncbi:MAG: DUF3857 domain-containing protein [Bacteroidota bacterium]